MPPICLTDIKDIANIIKQKYSKVLHNMTFVFCYKRGIGKYLIFQEIHAMPIQRFIYHESNDSISFSAGWASWGSPYSLVADANFEQVEVWQDLLDRSRLYNTDTNNYGGFNSISWKLGNRKNKTEKNRKKKTKFDTIFEFRTDSIERAIFYQWGFEIYSASLSFLALDSNYTFPYRLDGITDVDDETGYDADEEEIQEIRWNGKTFDINEKVSVGNNFYDLGKEVNVNEPSSYWDRNECDPANKEFDEYLARKFLNLGKEEIEGVLEVGQRKIDLLL